MPKPEAPKPPPPIEDPDIGVLLARRWPRLFGWLVDDDPIGFTAGHTWTPPPPTPESKKPIGQPQNVPTVEYFVVGSPIPKSKVLKTPIHRSDEVQTFDAAFENPDSPER